MWASSGARAAPQYRARMPPRTLTLATALLIMCALAGCGKAEHHVSAPLHLPPDYVPVGVGLGRAFRPPPTIAAVRAGRPVAGLQCRRARGARYGAHLEIFAHNRVVAIPTGIGIRPPLELNEARVQDARCYYPVMTTDPTGVIEIRAGARVTLGTLFTLWGEPLSRRRVAGFHAPRGRPLVAYVGTRPVGVARWRGDPRAIPLRRHTRIVLELASAIPPHTTYEFPPGL